jgi:hypothetical protein
MPQHFVLRHLSPELDEPVDPKKAVLPKAFQRLRRCGHFILSAFVSKLPTHPK